MKKTFSCIIPYYNEGENILSVLEAVNGVEEIDQIIVIDDGSTDKISELIEVKFPKVFLITLEKNIGKGPAVAEGLKRIKNEYIFLTDAA